MSPQGSLVDTKTSSARPAMVALICGLSAALPMYLWQSQPAAAGAAFVIAGYTGWLWAVTREEAAAYQSSRAFLRRMPMNSLLRRVGRMLSDSGFWWTVFFGNITVVGAVYFAGMRVPEVLTGISCSWTLIAVCLSYGLTLHGPTTRCRGCGYQLAAHLDPQSPDQKVKCPECGRSWTKQQLCLVAPPIRRAA